MRKSVCIRRVISVIMLVISLLLLIIIVLSLIPVRCINRRVSRRLIMAYGGVISWVLVYCAEVGNKRVFVYLGEKGEIDRSNIKVDRSCLIVSNHICAYDTVIIRWMAQGMGVDPVYMAKESIKWIPVIGWSMSLSGFLFIKRKWEEDGRRIREWCRRECEGRTGLVLYPEGTRFSAEKRKSSISYLESNKLPVFDHLLGPRTKGFSSCLGALDLLEFKQIVHISVVYLEDKKRKDPPSFFATVFKRVPGTFYIYSTVEDTRDIKDGNAYLWEAFKRKDKIIDGIIDMHTK
ncbi:lysophosphatidic acid acyltransferase / lysophosphatidylinositol acyltransferase [Nematocida sp. LUAm3]|nr:lysophosphatidic acid acyltransferase / lysophosphatidylinositol acyltransferase [Nematocida sp. LUAm3]KAI5173880.1 lysophosphatidic acid acyltransferase / lysophosphatidylinositol acyltransferase [Nematocida sp. LUAm2]KAI5177375.1 lysophosphatidic acid acyltransferase / lysophosphatidylinositol acyltransferase [Nematocida sp. LUAm1]